MNLHALGVEWSQICRRCIPNHAILPTRARRKKETDLRAGCRSRRNATRREH
jgi:hypothetical protein